MCIRDRDSIINAFGAEQVAEITGRGRRFVQTRDEEGNLRVVEERRGRNASRVDAEAFQADRKSVLVFSGAGGTGYSFHADNTAENRRRRIHYILQPGWSAPGAVQGFGRTHRTNQASSPHYVLPTTDLAAQKRFVSSIARRLDQLGALTRGQRQTTSQGLFTAADNLKKAFDGTGYSAAGLTVGTVTNVTNHVLADLRKIGGASTGDYTAGSPPRLWGIRWSRSR